MKLRFQIIFLSVVVMLIIAIAALSLYSNGLKRLRKLEKNTRATWGDVEWRLEERNQFLPVFFDKTKTAVSGKAIERVMDSRERLGRAIREGKRLKIIQYANELDDNLSAVLSVVDSQPDLKQDDNFLKLRKSLYDLEGRIRDDKNSYNREATKLNNFLRSILGVVIVSNEKMVVIFES